MHKRGLVPKRHRIEISVQRHACGVGVECDYRAVRSSLRAKIGSAQLGLGHVRDNRVGLVPSQIGVGGDPENEGEDKFFHSAALPWSSLRQAS